MPLMETKTHFGIQTGAVAPMPHEIRIDLGATYNLSNSATCQGKTINGTIKDYGFTSVVME